MWVLEPQTFSFETGQGHFNLTINFNLSLFYFECDSHERSSLQMNSTICFTVAALWRCGLRRASGFCNSLCKSCSCKDGRLLRKTKTLMKVWWQFCDYLSFVSKLSASSLNSLSVSMITYIFSEAPLGQETIKSWQQYQKQMTREYLKIVRRMT